MTMLQPILMYYVTPRKILLEFLDMPENLLNILIFQYSFLLECVHQIQPEFIVTFRCQELLSELVFARKKKTKKKSPRSTVT